MKLRRPHDEPSACGRLSRPRSAGAAFGVTVVLALGAAAGCSSQADPESDGSTPPSSTAAEPTATDSTATPRSTPGPTATPTPTPDEPRTVSLLVSGDVLLHSGTWETARADAARRGKRGLDFRPMLSSVAPVVRAADVAICHLETPLASPRGPFASYPVFSAPPQVVPALLDTGYDACTTASNHSLDQGPDGLARTLRILDREGLEHDGSARSSREHHEPLLLDVDGVRLAVLSYTYGTNGIPLPPGQPWAVPLIDPEEIVADAAAARRDGADVVAVALHFGTEYVTAPDPYQVGVVKKITRSDDIDVVYGHHAHTVQPVDRVHGTWVAYGLGNFVAQQETSRPYTYRGVSVRFDLTQRPDDRFEVTDIAYLPTLITPYDSADPRMRVLDVPAKLGDRSTPPQLRQSLSATLAAVRSDVLSLGADDRDPDVAVRLLRR